MTDRLDAERLWTIPRVGSPVSGGSTVVVPVTTYDQNESTTRLWRLDGDEPTPLTDPDRSATSPSVSADGTKLAFLRTHDGRRQVHLLDLEGGESERVTDLPLGAVGTRWLPDGSGLVVIGALFRGFGSIEDTTAERDRRREDHVTARVTEDAVYRFWDRWLTDGEVSHLFLLDLASRSLRHLTSGRERWMRWDGMWDPADDMDVSPDGSEVAFVADRLERPDRTVRWSLYTLDLETGAERSVTPEASSHVFRPRYTPDGASVVYGMQRTPDFYADRIRLVAWDRQTDAHRVLTEEWDGSALRWVVSEDTVWFLAEDRGRVPLWTIPVEGGRPETLATGGTLAGLCRTTTGEIFASESGLDRPPEIVEIDENGMRVVTEFARPAVSDLELGAVEEVSVAGADGTAVQVFLVNPPGAEGGSPPPLVQVIHGGPHAASGDGWHWRWNAQVFARPGYLVAMVNFHGSTSFGQDFTESILGAWGDKPTRDVEACTDFLVAEGRVDPSRMAVTGGSYGGYLTAWLVSQTDRYACAVAHAAVTDLPGMYASDLTAGRRHSYGAEVFEDLAQVNRWSPAAHAAGYSTPTLVIHGDRDFRVPSTQGLEFYGVLKAKGVEARLVTYPDENHWILSPANSIHWYGEFEAWLGRYLGRS